MPSANRRRLRTPVMPDDPGALCAVQSVLLHHDIRHDRGGGDARQVHRTASDAGRRAAVGTRHGMGGARARGIRLQVSGLEHVGSGAALIASRHQSAFDTFVWLTLVPRCCYVLKRELLRIPLFGPLLPLSGMIAVDREGGANALRGLMREGVRAAREQRQIVIFPEGTRAEPGSLLPLQPGVAALAARTHLPVIPVVTDSGRCWGRRAFHKRPGTIHVRDIQADPARNGACSAHVLLGSRTAERGCGKLCGLSASQPRV